MPELTLLTLNTRYSYATLTLSTRYSYATLTLTLTLLLVQASP